MSEHPSWKKQIESDGGTLSLRLDCRHYLGDRPCLKGCTGSCEHYEPMGKRILIIKLGALGDVLRTESLLPGLKNVYPRSHITWVTRANGCRLLANNPLIDRLLEFNAETLCHLTCEHFDVLLSLDKEAGPAGLAMHVKSPDKRGIGLTPNGTAYPLDARAEHYFALGLCDALKFEKNHSTYPRLIYEALGLVYGGERYRVYLAEANRAHAHRVLASAGLRDGEAVIGLNTGAGTAFANKTWPAEKFVTLGRRLMARGDCRVALLGGPGERQLNDEIAHQLGPGVVHPGCENQELDFAAIVRRCTAILTADSAAMHIGIALQVPTVVLFGPTCPQEIDLFGRGVKLISKIDCAPCYKRACDLSPNCMDWISVEQAETALARYLKSSAQPLRIRARNAPGRTARDGSSPLDGQLA